MSSVSYYKRKDSPYFFLRIYKSKTSEPDPKKRRTSKTTKIPTTRDGERQIKQQVKLLNAALIRKEHQKVIGISFDSTLLFSKGRDLFLESKPDLADKTVEAYKLASRHLISACSDKEIDKYFDSDYSKFITYLNKKNISDTSKAIFTRHLSAMWNYFVSRNWAEKNIILIVKSTKTNTMPIPYNEMQKILKYYKGKNIQQYYLVYFLLLTGMRPSSAVKISWENIFFEQGYIKVENVKGKKDYYFPLHNELEKMLKEMKPQKKGILFPYETQVKFFNKDCSNLFTRGNIGHKYNISQLRNTFSSYLLNKGVNLGTIQKLLDHSDQRITKKHYVEFEMNFLRDEVNKVKFKK